MSRDASPAARPSPAQGTREQLDALSKLETAAVVTRVQATLQLHVREASQQADRLYGLAAAQAVREALDNVLAVASSALRTALPTQLDMYHRILANLLEEHPNQQASQDLQKRADWLSTASEASGRFDGSSKSHPSTRSADEQANSELTVYAAKSLVAAVQRSGSDTSSERGSSWSKVRHGASAISVALGLIEITNELASKPTEGKEDVESEPQAARPVCMIRRSCGGGGDVSPFAMLGSKRPSAIQQRRPSATGSDDTTGSSQSDQRRKPKTPALLYRSLRSASFPSIPRRPPALLPLASPCSDLASKSLRNEQPVRSRCNCLTRALG